MDLTAPEIRKEGEEATVREVNQTEKGGYLPRAHLFLVTLYFQEN